jgi:WD40 repeat protein
LHAVGHVRRRTFLAAGVLVATAIVPSGDAFGGKYPFVGHTGEVHTVAFDVDGKLLASGGMDGTVRLWNTATGHLIKTFAVSDPVMSVAFAPRSRRFLVGAGGGSVKSLETTQNVESGTMAFIYRNPACEVGCAITSVAFSPDGRFLAGGGLDRVRKATIWLWQASTQNLAKTLTGHTRTVVSVAFSPDSKTLATGSDDDTIRLWNPATAHSTSTFKHAGRPDALAFSPDGKTLASGGMDGIIRLWNVTTGHSTSLTGHSAYVTSVAFSPDGKTLATGSHDKSVRLWRLATGRTIKVLTGTGSVTSVAFSPDGKTLAGSYDKTIRLWKTDG